MKKILAAALLLCLALSLCMSALAAVKVTPAAIVFGDIDPELEKILDTPDSHKSQGLPEYLDYAVGEEKSDEMIASLGKGTSYMYGWQGRYADWRWRPYWLSDSKESYKYKEKLQDYYDSIDRRLGSKNNPYAPRDIERRIPSDTNESVDLTDRYYSAGSELFRITGKLVYDANPAYPNRWVLPLKSEETGATTYLTFAKK